MTSILKLQLQHLPSGPGVYQFFDSKDKLLYVGKAKSLQMRVRSYFQTEAQLSPAKQLMVQQTHHLATIEVTNETEALLLERSLIKQHRPPFNVDLKDDKSWLYISINYNEVYPEVELCRRPHKTTRLKLFGPYVSGTSIKSLFHFLKKTLGLKNCHQAPDKPCFQATLGRCLGHNLGKGSRQLYLKQLKYLEQILKGNTAEVKLKIQEEMRMAARKKLFEKAARLRDQWQALDKLTEKQTIVSQRPETFDIFALALSSARAAITRLPVRRGIMQEIDRFLLENTKGLSEEEIMTDFIEQYSAEATDLATRIYLPFKLKLTHNNRLYFVPQRGYKKKLLILAQKAAQNHLEQSAATWLRRQIRAQQGLKQLRDILGLKIEPSRIEGYDISNIQGREAVGAMVVLTNGLPDYKQYRKFKIHAAAKPNDVLMMAEVLRRRFTLNKDWPKPDLVMLDGGRPQLNIVQKTLTKAGVSIPLVALAKKEEILYVPWLNKPIKLPPDAPGLLLLESLRDEAHRFGLAYYRWRHRQKSLASAWNELPGVGPKLKKKLKSTFGSIENLYKTNEKDLAKVIGPTKARAIKLHMG